MGKTEIKYNILRGDRPELDTISVNVQQTLEHLVDKVNDLQETLELIKKEG